MKISSVTRHYLYVPYKPPVDPYWGWQAPCHGAHAVIVEMRTDDGLTGWGETAGREKEFHHTAAAAAVIGLDPRCVTQNAAVLRSAGHTPVAISGLEMAMWDLVGQVAGLPLYQLLGGRVRDRVPLCGLMGVNPPERAAEIAREYVAVHGFQTIKTKAGRAVEEDAAIAQALHAAVGATTALRFDANQNYTPGDVLTLAATYRGVNLQYFEQPVPHRYLPELAALRRAAGIPIALNESVKDARSVLEIARLEAADALVVDIPDAGGIGAVCRAAAVAEAAGLPCAFHSWHDLGIKTAAMAHVVSACPAFSLASDTTYHGLVGDIIATPFTIRDGSLTPPDAPGLGVTVNHEALERFRKAEPD